MKYCKKCETIYADNATFCGKCGSVLETPKSYDIFGEEIIKEGRKENKESSVNNDKITTSKNILLPVVGLVLSLLPFVGLIFSSLGLYLNINDKKFDKRKFYIILSVVGLAISIIFTIIAFKYNLFDKVFRITETEV